MTCTHLKHQWHTRREEGHKHKVVGQDGHATEAAHDFQLPHTCSTNKKNVYKTEQSLIIHSIKPARLQVPDMVPTPITKHSTRASKVKVGPSTAMPRAILSLTSSCKAVTRKTSQGCGRFACRTHSASEHWCPTWELELKANLARAHALERSMSSRKKGSASLQVEEQNYPLVKVDLKKGGKDTEIVGLFSYLRPVSSLSRKWMTTVLNTKLENIVKRPAMPAREQKSDIYRVHNVMEANTLKIKKSCLFIYFFLPRMYLDPSCLKFWNWK